MPSFLDGWANSGQAAPETRRKTLDHDVRPLTSNNTPSMSRSSSVASNRSEPATPSWYSAYEGKDTSKIRNNSTTSRNNSTTSTQKSVSPRSSSTKLTQKPGTNATSGWKALFNADDRKEKKKQKQKNVEKLVLTSRHAAAVKTRMAVDPNFAESRRRSSSGSEQSMQPVQQSSQHMTAAQQEMRFPHSGPPALKQSTKGHFNRKGRSGEEVEADMPALTRIISGDENDEESERAAQWRREEWVRKRNEAAMRKFSVAEGSDEGSERGSVSRQGSWKDILTPEELAEGEVLGIDGIEGLSFVGAELEGDAYTPRSKAKGGMGAGWKRGENGKWTR